MIVGVPREIKAEEKRVAITPAGVAAFVAHGHQVLIEKGAGLGSGISDAEYREAGAGILPQAAKVWARADLVLKVKEPQPGEYAWLREDLVVFTYLHLAASRPLARELVHRRIVAFAYETIQLDDGSLPLLAPMSEVAGRLAVQIGAQCLQARPAGPGGSGGRGILLSGASGVKPANVVILGAGIAGANACGIAVGMGAHVTVLDVNPGKLRYLHDVMGGHVTTVMSNPANVAEEVAAADLVIGTILIPGARTPKVVTRDIVRAMRPGAAIVDIDVDQGGCCETSRPTTLAEPTYVAEGVVHYCVTNMPSAVPRTSTYALTNTTLSYALEIASNGWQRAVERNDALRRGLNVARGGIAHAAVAEAVGMKRREP